MREGEFINRLGSAYFRATNLTWFVLIFFLAAE